MRLLASPATNRSRNDPAQAGKQHENHARKEAKKNQHDHETVWSHKVLQCLLCLGIWVARLGPPHEFNHRAPKLSLVQVSSDRSQHREKHKSNRSAQRTELEGGALRRFLT